MQRYQFNDRGIPLVALARYGIVSADAILLSSGS